MGMYTYGTVEATFKGVVEVVDIEEVDDMNDIGLMLLKVYGQEDDDPDEFLTRVEFKNATGFAQLLFNVMDKNDPKGGLIFIPEFDDTLSRWLKDEHHRQAMGEYMDELAKPDLKEFHRFYRGQYLDGADFAEQYASEGEIPSWVVVDWERTWSRGLVADHTITDGGHVFHN